MRRGCVVLEKLPSGSDQRRGGGISSSLLQTFTRFSLKYDIMQIYAKYIDLYSYRE